MNIFSKILNSFFGKVPEETRPRYGRVIRYDGSYEPVVFHPTVEDPKIFRAKLVGTNEDLKAASGDMVKIDVLGPGQAVTWIMRGDSPSDYDG